MTRYDIRQSRTHLAAVIETTDNGEWVRYADVEPMLAKARLEVRQLNPWQRESATLSAIRPTADNGLAVYKSKSRANRVKYHGDRIVRVRISMVGPKRKR